MTTIQQSNQYCIIMAGGVGSRFWPVSRIAKPKQFLDILGTGKSFLQMTYNRFAKICKPENILIVTSDIYKDLVKEQLPQISDNRILLEPSRKNTAPCIAYACYKIKAECENANIVVTPADHLVIDETEFVNIVNKGLDFTKNNPTIVTLGIQPSRPETEYGYIQKSNVTSPITSDYKGIYPVKTFTEKPELSVAKRFFQSGEFYWNSGIFIWNLNTILDSFNQFLPEINQLFLNGLSYYNTESEDTYIRKIYPECKSISIDYGLIEKAENVFVLPADFGWSDLGTWGSLYENSEKDLDKNTVIGGQVILYNTKNCIVNMANKNKLVVVRGLDGFIIAETDDALLVIPRNEENNIRQIVNDVTLNKGEKFV